MWTSDCSRSCLNLHITGRWYRDYCSFKNNLKTTFPALSPETYFDSIQTANLHIKCLISMWLLLVFSSNRRLEFKFSHQFMAFFGESGGGDGGERAGRRWAADLPPFCRPGFTVRVRGAINQSRRTPRTSLSLYAICKAVQSNWFLEQELPGRSHPPTTSSRSFSSSSSENTSSDVLTVNKSAAKNPTAK